MSYVADRHRIWLARSCPTATTILSVHYRIPVIAHVDKASATNRGPLSRLSSSASSSSANERLTTVARASSSNNVGAFRTRRVLAERLHADLCLASRAPGDVARDGRIVPALVQYLNTLILLFTQKYKFFDYFEILDNLFQTIFTNS